MSLLSRDQILQADDRQAIVMPVPEWGGDVRIAVMSGKDRERFEAAVQGKDNIRAKLCAMCIVDDMGKPVFLDADIEALSSKSAIALDRVFQAAQQLNYVTNSEVEELSKN